MAKTEHPLDYLINPNSFAAKAMDKMVMRTSVVIGGVVKFYSIIPYNILNGEEVFVGPGNVSLWELSGLKGHNAASELFLREIERWESNLGPGEKLIFNGELTNSGNLTLSGHSKKDLETTITVREIHNYPFILRFVPDDQESLWDPKKWPKKGSNTVLRQGEDYSI